MINPAELVDNLVALLRDIPELVAEMEGDAERIYAYHDQYPKRASLAGPSSASASAIASAARRPGELHHA